MSSEDTTTTTTTETQPAPAKTSWADLAEEEEKNNKDDVKEVTDKLKAVDTEDAG